MLCVGAVRVLCVGAVRVLCVGAVRGRSCETARLMGSRGRVSQTLKVPPGCKRLPCRRILRWWRSAGVWRAWSSEHVQELVSMCKVGAWQGAHLCIRSKSVLHIIRGAHASGRPLLTTTTTDPIPTTAIQTHITPSGEPRERGWCGATSTGVAVPTEGYHTPTQAAAFAAARHHAKPAAIHDTAEHGTGIT